VVSHDAFGYLGARYGLNLHPINGLSPDAEPSPAHLAELADLIESEGVTTVFSETLASPELADSLAGDLGLETAVLDPIEGLTEETEDEDYLSLMRANLAALRTANDCS
jgi:zinc transport system substrate-binding protein